MNWVKCGFILLAGMTIIPAVAHGQYTSIVPECIRVNPDGSMEHYIQVLDWFKTWVGYPREAAGTLVGGGSIANLTALACARMSRVGEMSDDLVGYVSDHSHSSVARAARVLGLRSSQLRLIPVGADHRMSPRAADEPGYPITGAPGTHSLASRISDERNPHTVIPNTIPTRDSARAKRTPAIRRRRFPPPHHRLCR